jgi:hypothetical protein
MEPNQPNGKELVQQNVSTVKVQDCEKTSMAENKGGLGHIYIYGAVLEQIKILSIVKHDWHSESR